MGLSGYVMSFRRLSNLEKTIPPVVRNPNEITEKFPEGPEGEDNNYWSPSTFGSRLFLVVCTSPNQ